MALILGPFWPLRPASLMIDLNRLNGILRMVFQSPQPFSRSKTRLKLWWVVICDRMMKINSSRGSSLFAWCGLP